MPATVDLVLGRTFNCFGLNLPMQKGDMSNDGVYSQVSWIKEQLPISPIHFCRILMMVKMHKARNSAMEPAFRTCKSVDYWN